MADATQKKFPWLYAVLGIVVLFAIWMFSGYNGLVAERENVDNAFRQVETQYQRRFDLIPNLVSTVKGAANFEQSTLTAVTEARTQWQNAGSTAERVEAANEFDSALSRLLVTVEAYPQLQATQAFRDLMVETSGTENRIAVARRDYNDAVAVYNVRVKRFPTNILAGLFGYGAEPGFQATAGSENAPVIDFNQ